MTEMKVSCVGHPGLHDFFKNQYTNWDWQTPVEDVQTFKRYHNEGVIDSETRIIFVWDNLFDTQGSDRTFQDFIAFLAPYAMIAIINYNPLLNGQIKEAISNSANRLEVEEAPFWFIEKDNPFESIDRSISECIQKHDNEELVEALREGVGSSVVNLSKYAPSDEGSSGDDSEDYDDSGYQGAKSFLSSDETLGKVVAVTSSKGGSGKSTISLSLASYIARASRASKKAGIEDKALSVAIVELDIREGQIGFLTGFSKPTVINIVLAKGAQNPQIIKRESAIENDSLKCDMYLAPKRPKAAEETPPQFYSELIQTLRTMYDFVILDTSANYLDPLLSEVAYPMADQIIFVTDLGVSSIYGMTRWILEVTGDKEGKGGMGIPKGKVGIVVNKSMPDIGMDARKIRRSSLQLPILAVMPSMPKLITSAANDQSLEMLTQNPELSKQFRRIATVVVGKSYELALLS